MQKLTPRQWQVLRDHLIQEYGPSMLIRHRQRRELGFTSRVHRQFNQAKGYPEQNVCLDFYDDRLEAWFVLKYSGHFQ